MVDAARAGLHLEHEGRLRGGDRGIDVAVDDAIDRGGPATDFDLLDVGNLEIGEGKQRLGRLLQSRRTAHPGNALALEIGHRLDADILGDGKVRATAGPVDEEQANGHRPPGLLAEGVNGFLSINAIRAGGGELRRALLHRRQARDIVFARQDSQIDAVLVLEHRADGDHLAVARRSRIVSRGDEGLWKFEILGDGGSGKGNTAHAYDCNLAPISLGHCFLLMIITD